MTADSLNWWADKLAVIGVLLGLITAALGLLAAVVGVGAYFFNKWASDAKDVKAKEEIARIDPVNRSIKSLTADVYLWVRDSDLANKPEIAKGVTPKEAVDFGISNNSEDALNPASNPLALLQCEALTEGEVLYTPEGEDFKNAVKVRSFSMVFSWPGTGFIDGHFAAHPELRPWIYGNVSTSDFDKKHPTAFISMGFLPEGAKILRGSCVLTINGSIRREFIIPASSSPMRIIFTPAP